MFALGLLSWLYDRPAEGTLGLPQGQVRQQAGDHATPTWPRSRPGWNFGETTEAFRSRYEVKPAPLPPGDVPQHHRQHGAGLRPDRRVAAGRAAAVPRLLPDHPGLATSCTNCPGTSASGVRTFQAEDEIAGQSARRSAPRSAASLGVTTTSGPGMLLKAETIGLAVSVELPLIIVDIQRAGPSTGMPTKTEQADLLQAMFGRNGESPGADRGRRARPADCFHAAIEAARIAIKYRTPVFLLSDGYLANGSEPWRIPDVASLPDLTRSSRSPTAGRARRRRRSSRSGATRRPWPGHGRSRARRAWSTASAASRRPTSPGTSPTTRTTTTAWSGTRQAKIDGIAADIPPLEVDDPDGDARVLVLGWGSTFGPIGAAVRRVRQRGGDGGPGAPAPPQPVPAEPRRRARAGTTGCSCRKSTSASSPCCCGRDTWST